MTSELHIASLLVHLRPDRGAEVRTAIAAWPGVEIHAEQGGKMVVTLEGPDEGWITEHLTSIHLLPGVFSAVLVFHHAEPLEEAAVQDAGMPG